MSAPKLTPTTDTNEPGDSSNDVAGMFIGLYADCKGLPIDTVFEQAAALRDTDDYSD